MSGESKICKCGDKSCLGFVLLHEKELSDLEKITESIRKDKPLATFDLRRSPSSGEIFTKFYELHVLLKKVI